MTLQPKPLPEHHLPPLRQIGKPLRRVDASSLREEGQEQAPAEGVLASDDALGLGDSS